MKKLLLLPFSVVLILSLNCLAQPDYQTNLIDSVRNTTFNQGTFGLTAVEHNDMVHLCYYYGSQDENWSLVYEVRNNGQQISREVAHDFGASGLDRSSKTAIQFDDNGQVYIYGAYRTPTETKLTVFTKTAQWSSIDLNYTPFVYYLHASKNGTHQLGFVTQKKYFNVDRHEYQIDFFEPIGGVWTQQTISSSEYTKTNPTCFHTSSGESYISFVEGHHPDTTELYIYQKEPNQWEQDYHMVYDEQVSFIGDLAGYEAGRMYSYFGEEDGIIHLTHNMDNPDGVPSQLTHLQKTTNGWESLPISNPQDYPGNGRFNGSELEFDSNGTLFWVDNYNAVRYVQANHEYGAFNIPLGGASYWDFVVADNKFHIYYSTGDNAYPWGDDLKFYESILDLNSVFTDVDYFTLSGADLIIYPNPAIDKVRIKVDGLDTETSVQLIDMQGTLIQTARVSANMVLDFQLPETAGLYLLQFVDEKGNTTTRKVLKH